MKNPLQCQTRETIHQKKVVNKLHLKSRFPDFHLSHQKVLPPKIMLLQDLLSHKSRILLNTALQAAINPQALIYELTRSLFMMQSWLYHLKVEQKHFWEWKKTLETFAWLSGVMDNTSVESSKASRPVKSLSWSSSYMTGAGSEEPSRKGRLSLQYEKIKVLLWFAVLSAEGTSFSLDYFPCANYFPSILLVHESQLPSQPKAKHVS